MTSELPKHWTSTAGGPSDAEKDRASVVSEMLLKESDRGCAIFGAAILHDDLEYLLRSFFRTDAESVKQVIDPLFEGYAPLANFSSRIQIAYAMKLITRELKRKLDIVRRLRNDFAHEAGPISFDDPRCRDRLRILIADGKSAAQDPGTEPRMFGGQLLTRRQFTDRLAFIIAVAELSGRMRFIREMIESGRDIRGVITALEAGGC